MFSDNIRDEKWESSMITLFSANCFKSFKKIKEGCTSLSKPSIALTRSHSEDASFGVLDGSVERDCHAEAQHSAQVFRQNYAIVPQSGCRVVRATLLVVVRHNSVLEPLHFLRITLILELD